MDFMPGWTHGTYGLHADDGIFFCCGDYNESARLLNEEVTVGDIIGCGVHAHSRVIFFTRNREMIGKF
jgi:hypothetical protein